MALIYHAIWIYGIMIFPYKHGGKCMTNDPDIFDCVLLCRFLSYPDDVHGDNVFQLLIFVSIRMF